MRWVIYATMAFIVAYNLLAILRGITLCNPPQNLWLAFKPGTKISYAKTCANGGPWRIAVASTNIATDFFITLLPLSFIHRLKINERQKFALYGLFASGFL